MSFDADFEIDLASGPDMLVKDDSNVDDEFHEPVYRGMDLTAVPEAEVHAAAADDGSAPPRLPPSPFYLEATHLRSEAAPRDIMDALCEAAKRKGCVIAKNDSKFKIRGYKHEQGCGLEFVARIYADYASLDLAVEVQSVQTRHRAEFLRFYNELAAELVDADLACVPREAAALRREMRPFRALSVPMSLSSPRSLPSCESDDDEPATSPASTDASAPLREMIQSPDTRTQIEGSSSLASICASSPSSTAVEMADMGTLSCAVAAACNDKLHYEVRLNCLEVAGKLLAKACGSDCSKTSPDELRKLSKSLALLAADAVDSESLFGSACGSVRRDLSLQVCALIRERAAEAASDSSYSEAVKGSPEHRALHHPSHYVLA